MLIMKPIEILGNLGKFYALPLHALASSKKSKFHLKFRVVAKKKYELFIGLH